MNINFKLIGTFLSVAQNESFRKAAEETNRSLPAVSMQVKQLEEQLGVALFQRTTRKVALTQEGEQLLISARKALAELEVGLSHIQHAADVQQGHLSFACVPTIASTRLPAILTAFAKKYPGISVHVRELANQDLLEAVRRREVDFAIGPVPEKKGELEFAPIFVDDYCAMLPRGYQDNGRASISLRELSKLPLLKLSSSTAFRDHVDNALKANGLSHESNYEFMQVTTLVAMAEAGLGIALLPRVALPRRTPLKVVRIIGPALSRTIAIVTIRGHSLSPAAARLVEMCNKLIAAE
ncbi:MULTISPECIES: LysR family transcriptional regulator [unclassified Variovorax]|uniref:LysR family transcriptional regulator n=1 Tax=unclassified Variovorax TaxID=663243 RepID=UPI0008E3BB59|nr:MULTISPECIES: LysR family transcriptional regulator [unclassified Variovorax]KAF1061384.1 MAG: HTH-type transcriptional regulator GltC [Variovorax sp.]TAJ64807.1 MAG: LysR family transcriptional regulator [Variovorax sp.]SFP78468.1 DNA-binding transcriptional regulator, LysR family [Variovorax sp. PDC80]